MHKILVINPNSNTDVTVKLSDIFREYHISKKTKVDCISIQDGPFGIESDEDIHHVSPLVIKKIKNELLNYDAFVIACYSDPGLSDSKLVFSAPIYGIHETTVKFCHDRKIKFGVIALGEESIKRHYEYIRKLSLSSYYVGEVSINMDVNEAVNGENTMMKIYNASKNLIQNEKAEAIILGCAGMAKYRESLEKQLGVKVLDPVQTSVDCAIMNL